MLTCLYKPMINAKSNFSNCHVKYLNFTPLPENSLLQYSYFWRISSEQLCKETIIYIKKCFKYMAKYNNRSLKEYVLLFKKRWEQASKI